MEGERIRDERRGIKIKGGGGGGGGGGTRKTSHTRCLATASLQVFFT